MERGEVGLGRGGYGLPRRRRLGDRRAYRPGRGSGGTGARGTNAVTGRGDDEDDEYYGQLLRRPGDRPAYPREPGRPGTRQPGRFAPPADGYPPAGQPPDGIPAGYPGSGDPASGHAGNGGFSPNGGPGTGGYPPSGPGTDVPPDGGRVSGAGYRGPVNAGPAPGRPYWPPNGRRVPPAADRLYRPPVPGSAGGTHRRRGPGQDPTSGTWRRPARPSPAGTQPGSAAGWERLRVPPAGRAVPITAETAAAPGPAGPSGPVIRQQETHGSGRRPVGPAQSVASIAPDGLESFARDLRALRAKAELDYPEMAELSHYTMKTLASAAGGLRLPTLPVAVAYVRACGGDAAEWEDRWQKLAAKITTDGAKKRRSDDDDQHAQAEPAAAPAVPEPLARPAAQDPDPGPGEVYLITSAKPRQPGWPGSQGETGGGQSP